MILTRGKFALTARISGIFNSVTCGGTSELFPKTRSCLTKPYERILHMGRMMRPSMKSLKRRKLQNSTILSRASQNNTIPLLESGARDYREGKNSAYPFRGQLF